MNIKVSNKDIVVGVVAAVIGATISTTMAPADSYGYVNADGTDRQSIRSENPTPTVRDSGMELQEQARRNARLRALQEQEAVHNAALTEGDELLENDVRAHYRAYRHCTFRGYTRGRLHTCVESVLINGAYDPLMN